jgi:hypothetical protein
MDRPNIYVAATDIEEYEKLAKENNLPAFVITTPKEVSKLNSKTRKFLDVYYTKAKNGETYYINALYLDTYDNIEKWGKFVYPDGTEKNIKRASSYTYISYDNTKYEALQYETGDGEKIKCLEDVVNFLKPEVQKLRAKSAVRNN